MRPAGGPSGLSSLPHTGQTACHDQSGNAVDCTSDTCAGQDALYATGCSTEDRFVDNGDGTVTDNCTGLMWQKDTGNDEDLLDWCSALAYCESLELAGHDDWRLPNVRELHSIVDYGRIAPSVDPVFGAISEIYWSATSHRLNRHYAWYVTFNEGNVVNNRKTAIGVVRAVRGGV